MRWRFNRLRFAVRKWLTWTPRSKPEVIQLTPEPKWHVVILDGTLSSFEKGRETNAGQLAKLLSKSRPNVYVYYEPGLQFDGWKSLWALATGKGIGAQIRRAYQVLSYRYQPGDKIILAGYSRGAFAVRSLSGMIDAVGLLHHDCVNDRSVDQAWRFYREGGKSKLATYFQANYCYRDVLIEAVGVWDTVRGLGLRPPFLNRLIPDPHSFHSHDLPSCVKAGFHAMARDEVRLAFDLVKWAAPHNAAAELRQVWFRGSHGDVGGHLTGFEQARPLSNVPFVWMVEQFEARNLPLPADWRDHFPCDPSAPALGSWRGYGRLLFILKKRQICLDKGEELHQSLM